MGNQGGNTGNKVVHAENRGGNSGNWGWNERNESANLRIAMETVNKKYEE